MLNIQRDMGIFPFLAAILETLDFRQKPPIFFSGNVKILEADVLKVLKTQTEFCFKTGQWEPYLPARLIGINNNVLKTSERQIETKNGA